MIGRILVVEDEPVVLRFCERVLEREGYAVVSAVDVNTALRLAAPASSLTLALIDLVLPDGSGETVLRGLREAGMHGPIICMSGYPLSQVPGVARPLALSGYFLEKPFTRAELMAKVKAVLRGAQPGGLLRQGAAQ